MSYGFGFGPGKRARRAIGGGSGGTPAPLEVGAAAYDLSDDFDTPTGTGSIAARDNWSTPDGTFIQSTERAGFDGDGILYLASGQFGVRHARFGPSPDGFVGAHQLFNAVRLGDSDLFGNGWDHGRQAPLLWSIDDSNAAWLIYNPFGHRVEFSTQDATINSGNAQTPANFVSALGLDLSPPGQFDYQVELTPSDTLRLYVDKVPLKPSANPLSPDLDITSSISSGNRKGRPGFQAQDYDFPLMTFIGVRQADAVFHDFANSDRGAGHIEFGGSTGQPRIEGDYYGTPVQWIYRLWLASDTSTKLTGLDGMNDDGWRAITPAEATAPSGGTPGHVKLDPVLPDGNWIVEYGFLKADGSYVSTYAGSIIIARKVLFYGQSNAHGLWGPSSTSIVQGILTGEQADIYQFDTDGVGDNPDYPEGYIINGADSLGYSQPNMISHFTNAAVSLSGEPVIALVGGTNGASLDILTEGAYGWDDLITFIGNFKGVVEDVVFDQSEGNTWTTAANAAAGIPLWADEFLDGIVAPMRDLWGPDVRFHISMPGAYAHQNPPSGPEDWDVMNANVNAMRLAQLGLCYGYGQTDDPNIRLGAWRSMIQHDAGGGHHTGNSDGYPRVLERHAWSVEYARGNASHDGTGPRFTSAPTRSGAVINWAPDLNGAASLVDTETITPGGFNPSNKTGTVMGFRVELASAPGTALTISSVAVVGDDDEIVRITLDSDPGGPCNVYHLDGAEWSDATLVCGYYSDDDDDRPIPIQPSIDLANGRTYFVTAS